MTNFPRGCRLLWLAVTTVETHFGASESGQCQAQAENVPRVGFLCWVTCGDAYHEAFWQALRKLGYADYKNITFENRAAGGDGGSLDTLALELINLRPAVIVADTTQSARALKGATRTIPLVMTSVGDPIDSGFVASLAHPGGNITGLTQMAPQLSGKRLELLKETFPTISHVAVFGDAALTALGLSQNWQETQ